MATINNDAVAGSSAEGKDFSTCDDAASAKDGASANSVAQEDAASGDVSEDDVIDAVVGSETSGDSSEAAAEGESSSAGDAPAEQVEAALKEAAEWKDKYVRLHAEWDTYRRRQKEQAQEQKALAAEKLVSNLILVIDDLERSIDYAQKNGEAGLLGGVEAVLSKFIDTLKKDGVEVIDPKGEAFEALEAQAVGTVDDPTQPEETVADVYQKGYKIGRKVLRPAMVTITQGGPKREKPESEEAEGE